MRFCNDNCNLGKCNDSMQNNKNRDITVILQYNNMPLKKQTNGTSEDDPTVASITVTTPGSVLLIPCGHTYNIR